MIFWCAVNGFLYCYYISFSVYMYRAYRPGFKFQNWVILSKSAFHFSRHFSRIFFFWGVIAPFFILALHIFNHIFIRQNVWYTIHNIWHYTKVPEILNGIVYGKNWLIFFFLRLFEYGSVLINLKCDSGLSMVQSKLCEIFSIGKFLATLKNSFRIWDISILNHSGGWTDKRI